MIRAISRIAAVEGEKTFGAASGVPRVRVLDERLVRPAQGLNGRRVAQRSDYYDSAEQERGGDGRVHFDDAEQQAGDE